MGGAAVDMGPSDRGWGWAVLMGCFVLTGFSYAFPKAVSVFFKELIHEFRVGYSDMAWISSIVLAMLYGTGPLCTVLVNKFGCRPVMMVGGLLASLRMILGSFSTSVIHIYLCLQLCKIFPLPLSSCLGLALNFHPSLIMLTAGSPVALCCLSPLGQHQHQHQYGWRGGFLILGGLLLNCCACVALMRPLLSPKRKRELETEKVQIKRKLLDFTVFKDRGFVIYTVAASDMVLGLFVLNMYMKLNQESALLLIILGLVDMFACPACGVIAGMKPVRPRCVYLLSFAMLFNGCTDLSCTRVTACVTLFDCRSSARCHAPVQTCLAGAEVPLSAFILGLGNFFCIKTKHTTPPAATEMNVRAAERDTPKYDEGMTEDEKGDMRDKEVEVGDQEEQEVAPPLISSETLAENSHSCHNGSVRPEARVWSHFRLDKSNCGNGR
uniref:Solute carrier family 16 member 3 n=1 Tax=Neogobius melanostomus TaxID=47308 RepID=A0A8C6WM10_9GOBI